MNPKPLFRIGTRRSALAKWQAEHVAGRLHALGFASELVFISTEGDRVLDTPLPLMGGKGVFTKALDDALLAGEVDLAVHSLKDLPTEPVPGLTVAAVLERADPRDVLVVRAGTEFLESSAPATLATGSPRRAAQWLRRYPHHHTVDLRGNVPTRLAKLQNSTWDGAIFAAAGLARLGLEQHIAQYLDWMLPAPGQGAVAVVAPTAAPELLKALAALHHGPTAVAVAAERAVLAGLGSGCSLPVGARAEVVNGQVHLTANVVAHNGQEELRVAYAGGAEVGERAAKELRALGAEKLFAP